MRNKQTKNLSVTIQSGAVYGCSSPLCSYIWVCTIGCGEESRQGCGNGTQKTQNRHLHNIRQNKKILKMQLFINLSNGCPGCCNSSVKVGGVLPGSQLHCKSQLHIFVSSIFYLTCSCLSSFFKFFAESHSLVFKFSDFEGVLLFSPSNA